MSWLYAGNMVTFPEVKIVTGEHSIPTQDSFLFAWISPEAKTSQVINMQKCTRDRQMFVETDVAKGFVLYTDSPSKISLNSFIVSFGIDLTPSEASQIIWVIIIAEFRWFKIDNENIINTLAVNIM